jgi:hypothetical protein
MRLVPVRFAVLTALTFLFADAVAAAWLTLSPPAPRAGTPVTLRWISEPLPTCGPDTPTIRRDGGSIHIVLTRVGRGPCTADVDSRSVDIPLGPLPAGEYVATAVYSQTATATIRFVVRSASPQAQRLILSPTTGGIRLPVPEETREVTFDDMTLEIVRRFGEPPFVETPPHEGGLFDFRVLLQNGMSYAMEVYYFDRDQSPDLSVFEPVLIPIFDSASGALGTEWTSELVIGPSPLREIQIFNRDFNVPKDGTLRRTGEGYPHGLIVYVPREANPGFSLRVREHSRNDDRFGTEIPTVRESELEKRGQRLTNVPIGPDFRTRLRAFVIGPLPYREVFVAIDSESGEEVASRLFPMSAPENEVPAYAEIDLQSAFPHLGHLGRVTIRFGFDTNMAGWGFATVVDNATQRLSVVTAD